VSPPFAERDGCAFWVEYQPGFRVSEAPVGTPEFFAEVERDRYQLEPDIPEMSSFVSWQDKDVLEAGCGIATDGTQFARAGARYTGVDFSPTALTHARERFEREGLAGGFVECSITDLPFEEDSFDLVYSMGVIHHIPDTQRVVDEFRRVLRPGGRAIVMIYHRSSFNYHFSIMVLRRALIATLLVPKGLRFVAAATGEREEVLLGHRQLLRDHGLNYLRDRQMFLSNNTDGPGNPLSKVYRRAEAKELFSNFREVRTEVRFLHLRSYPGGQRLSRTKFGERLGNRAGWHLWIEARK
jgi:SAM-dependent methyltransferase